MARVLDEEHYVENAFLRELKRLEWQVYRQSKEDPEDAVEILCFTSALEPKYGNSKEFRDSFGKVVLEEVLKDSLKRINPWIEDDQIDEVVRRVTTPQANSLLEANKEIHDLLLENTSVSENRKTKERSPTVRFFDFENPGNNSFIAISQFKVKIRGTEKHIIPDIVLFVNGLPLVVVECKSPAIADPITEAITQLMRYSNRRGANEGNEALFWYNLFMVATCKQVAKYGTITSEFEHFVEWKDPYPSTITGVSSNDEPNSQQILIHGMLSKNNLLDLLHTFTVFKEDSKNKMVKVVARYQQFRAVKKAIKKLEEGKTPEERGGIIWHTQGSGKSLTMMYMVRELYHNPEFGNYKVVFITDRKDLEKQLNETSRSVGFTVKVAGSVQELKDLLKTNTPELVMAMIHKFQERDLKTEFPVLNESPNILIMIDEAHRTEYSLLGANLRRSLPNATKIAFTGTPIEKTERTFGDYIDKYSIRQSVEDGVTVEIVYEGRVHSAELTDKDKANAKFEDVFKDADLDTKRKILGKYMWKAYLEAEEVIRDKARDMVEHYISHVFPNGFKAQVVTVSREAAIRYKKALEQALREKIDELEKQEAPSLDLDTLKRLKVGVVISGSPNDPPEYAEYADPNEHEIIIKSFKLPFGRSDKSDISGDVGILVVQSMLITGFDAPIEQVMYLDNVIKGHNLLQAIARVNRVYKNKFCGYVVDYVGVFKHLKEALSIYADEDIGEISKVVKNKSESIDRLRYVYSEIERFFKKLGIPNWRHDVDKAITELSDVEARDEFIHLVRNFQRCMDEVLPDPEALKYASDLKILGFIMESARNTYIDEKLSLRDASNKIRKVVEEYLVTHGVDPKIPPTPVLAEDFLEKLRNKPIRLQTEGLKNAIVEYIHTHWEEDPELYERFSDRLEKLLKEYEENWDVLYEELKKLREEMKKGRESDPNFGLDPRKEMPFFGLLKNEIFGKKPYSELTDEEIEFLVGLTKELFEIIGRETQIVDFWDNEAKQRTLKSHIIKHLLTKASPKSGFLAKEGEEPYYPNTPNGDILSKRNKIAQEVMELAYHVFRKQSQWRA